jgi:hypothetical protein
MFFFLEAAKVRLLDFKKYVVETSERVKAAALAEAERRDRPVVYLTSSATSKEDLARKLLGLVVIINLSRYNVSILLQPAGKDNAGGLGHEATWLARGALIDTGKAGLSAIPARRGREETDPCAKTGVGLYCRVK